MHWLRILNMKEFNGELKFGLLLPVNLTCMYSDIKEIHYMTDTDTIKRKNHMQKIKVPWVECHFVEI